MRVLITGSSGRLGEQLADSLAPAHSIIGVDRRAGRRTTHVGDIADPDFVATAAAGADAILHTASLHAPDVARASKAAFIQTNLSGILNLLNAAVANRVERFVYTLGRVCKPSPDLLLGRALTLAHARRATFYEFANTP